MSFNQSLPISLSLPGAFSTLVAFMEVHGRTTHNGPRIRVRVWGYPTPVFCRQGYGIRVERFNVLPWHRRSCRPASLPILRRTSAASHGFAWR